MFRINVVTDTISNEHDWNFTILRDSADRSRKNVNHSKSARCDYCAVPVKFKAERGVSRV